MKRPADSAIFFGKPDEFREWLEKHHQISTEQWVGFHRKFTGRASITWPEAVDEALCFGWIDGLRKTINADSYKIRFTPRRPSSIWSATNIARIKKLIRKGRVNSVGMTAFQKRTLMKSRVCSYENRNAAKLSSAATKLFRAEGGAWKFFQRQPKSYRQTASWWVN
jgi:uncharacterized protein YdeI (YjbR/CyaY-like superfamily)